MLPWLFFTDCGDYVENERQNAFHKNWEKKNRKPNLKKKKKKNSSIPMLDTSSKAGTLRSL